MLFISNFSISDFSISIISGVISTFSSSKLLSLAIVVVGTAPSDTLLTLSGLNSCFSNRGRIANITMTADRTRIRNR